MLTAFAADRYDRDPSRYPPELYQRRRGDLLNAFESTLSPLSVAQFKLLHRVYLASFRTDLLARMTQDGADSTDLVTETSNHWERKFEDSAREASVESTEWKWRNELELLKRDIRDLADEITGDATNKVSDTFSIGVRI
jgi:protein SEY1